MSIFFEDILKSTGGLPPPPMPLPMRTCLFFPWKGGLRDTWSLFASTYNDEMRQAAVDFIAQGGGNSIICLLSNGDPANPVSFFRDRWGGLVDMRQLDVLERWAEKIAIAGGALWPCIFSDGPESAVIRDAPWECHQRALDLLLAHLRPYSPGTCIGLESNENLDCARHNRFANLLRYLAPDRYVVSHLQAVPAGGVPALDGVFYEHPWPPGEGNSYSPEECVSEAAAARARFGGLLLVATEYNLDVTGAHMRAQSRALLDAGFGCGGPC